MKETEVFDDSILDEGTVPFPDESKGLILLVVLQAKRDLVNFCDTTSPTLKESWEEAFSFIFDNDYYIDWGDYVVRLEDLLDVLDIDIRWARRKIQEQLAKQFERKNNGEEETRNNNAGSSKGG